MSEKKSLKLNVIMNAILNMSAFIFPLITFPYVSRVLMPEGTGKVSFATSLIAYFIMFAQLGIPTYGVRACSRVRDDRQALTRTAQELLILLVGFELGKSSVEKLLEPQPTLFGAALVIVMLLSVGIKLWMAAFNRQVGRHIGSATLTAAAADSRNDVLATAAVLASTVISHFTRIDLDGYMGVAVAAFILYSGVGMVKETISPLLGSAPDPETVQMIRDKIMSYPGVLGTHDLMLHDYGPGRQFASVHVEVAAERDMMESHDMVDNIEKEIRDSLGHICSFILLNISLASNASRSFSEG